MKIKNVLIGIIIGIVISTTVFAASYNVEIPNFKILVNGNEFKSDQQPLVVDGSTYLPLRAIGEALNVPVEWNDNERQVEIGSKPTLPVSYSRANPAPINTIQTYIHEEKYFPEDNYTVSLRILETFRGQLALDRIKAANMFNDDPDEGKEYILVKVAISCIATANDKAYDLKSYSFKAFSSNNEEYSSKSIVEPEPRFEGKIYQGGNKEGWVAFQVNKDDPAPKCVFDLNYDGTGGAWFNLQ